MHDHGGMIGHPYDPWSHAHALHVPVHTARLPPGLRGVTDSRTVWLDDRLTPTEARCTLTHELVHVQEGHTHHQPTRVEDQVRAATAHRLIPWENVLRYLGSQCTTHDAAEDLAVTEEILLDRLHHATLTELADLHHIRQGAHP